MDTSVWHQKPQNLAIKSGFSNAPKSPSFFDRGSMDATLLLVKLIFTASCSAKQLIVQEAATILFP
jgi:hypothetical protein